MNCEILETLYVKSNGDIPCNDDAGEQMLLGRVIVDSSPWSISDVLQNEKFNAIRRALRDGEAMPWPDICANCAFFRANERPSDRLIDRQIRKVQLEPSLACNLVCPGCCNSAQIRSRPKPHIMDIEVLRTLLDSLTKEGFEVEEFEYCGQGEPLMHPRFPEFVDLVREYYPGARQRLITNGNFDYEKATGARFIDEVIVSCDGLYQDNYQQYRQRGKVDKVLEFIRNAPSLVSGGKQALIWKYILFEHNDSDQEIIAAQEVSQQLGVDTLMFVFTHSIGKSKRFTPDNQHDLPLLFSNVRTNFTPIVFNRKIERAGQIKRRKRGMFSSRKRSLSMIDEVSVVNGETLNVRGWILSQQPIDSMTITLNQKPLGKARLGLPREDVFTAYPEFKERNSGFSLVSSLLPSSERTDHSLELLSSSGEVIDEYKFSY